MGEGIMDDLKAIIEAMIFSSETPLPLNKMKDALGDAVEKSDILREIAEIREEHDGRAGGFILAEVAGGYQFRTRAGLASWVRKLRGIRHGSLSPAAMETLAVIAYRQPVLKADIEKVRGVDVSGALKGLLEKKLIKMLGRKDVPGRPMMYGTSREFLEAFNLKDLSELPTLRELKELQEEAGATGDIFALSEGEEGDTARRNGSAAGEPAREIAGETGEAVEMSDSKADDSGDILAAGESETGGSGSAADTTEAIGAAASEAGGEGESEAGEK